MWYEEITSLSHYVYNVVFCSSLNMNWAQIIERIENAKTASTVNPEIEAGPKIEAGGLTQLY